MVPDCDDLFGAEGGLEAAEGATAVLDVLDYTIEVLKVFSDKAADVQVSRYAFFGAIQEDVFLSGATNRGVVDIGDRGVGDLRLLYVGNVIMKNRHRIDPTHREGDQAERTKRELEGGKVARCIGEAALIVANVEVKHTTASVACEVLADLVGKRGDAGVFDSNPVEGLEIVDDTE